MQRYEDIDIVVSSLVLYHQRIKNRGIIYLEMLHSLKPIVDVSPFTGGVFSGSQLLVNQAWSMASVELRDDDELLKIVGGL